MTVTLPHTAFRETELVLEIAAKAGTNVQFRRT